jgi:glycerophosphoryl diester phosphodiesterase
MEKDLKANYKKAINFGIKYNVEIIGPGIAAKSNDFKGLTEPWMVDLIHNAKMLVHPYTFNTNKEIREYNSRIDGLFTDRADLALEFYGRKNKKTPQEILTELGYN